MLTSGICYSLVSLSLVLGAPSGPDEELGAKGTAHLENLTAAGTLGPTAVALAGKAATGANTLRKGAVRGAASGLAEADLFKAMPRREGLIGWISRYLDLKAKKPQPSQVDKLGGKDTQTSMTH